MAIELTRTVTVRLSPELFERLKATARFNQLTRSEVVRQALQGLQPRPRRRVVADEELLQQLARYGNLLNQQTKVLHQLKHRGEFPQGEALLEVVGRAHAMLREVARRVEEVSR